MNFILAVDGQSKHTLYLNHSNTPKDVLKDQQISELEVDTEKPKLMAFIQVMLDQINDLNSKNVNLADLAVEEHKRAESALFDVTPVEAIVSLKPQIEEMENSAFRQLVEDRWEDQPLAWKLHMAAVALEDAREIINPTKYERIG